MTRYSFRTVTYVCEYHHFAADGGHDSQRVLINYIHRNSTGRIRADVESIQDCGPALLIVSVSTGGTLRLDGRNGSILARVLSQARFPGDGNEQTPSDPRDLASRLGGRDCSKSAKGKTHPSSKVFTSDSRGVDRCRSALPSGGHGMLSTAAGDFPDSRMVAGDHNGGLLHRGEDRSNSDGENVGLLICRRMDRVQEHEDADTSSLQTSSGMRIGHPVDRTGRWGSSVVSSSNDMRGASQDIEGVRKVCRIICWPWSRRDISQTEANGRELSRSRGNGRFEVSWKHSPGISAKLLRSADCISVESDASNSSIVPYSYSSRPTVASVNLLDRGHAAAPVLDRRAHSSTTMAMKAGSIPASPASSIRRILI